jgi:hypothetical protein
MQLLHFNCTWHLFSNFCPLRVPCTAMFRGLWDPMVCQWSPHRQCPPQPLYFASVIHLDQYSFSVIHVLSGLLGQLSFAFGCTSLWLPAFPSCLPAGRFCRLFHFCVMMLKLYNAIVNPISINPIQPHLTPVVTCMMWLSNVGFGLVTIFTGLLYILHLTVPYYTNTAVSTVTSSLGIAW